MDKPTGNFVWNKIVDSKGETIGVMRSYDGRDCFDFGIAPFVEWYFIEPDERGTPEEITLSEYDTLMAFHKESGGQFYLW